MPGQGPQDVRPEQGSFQPYDQPGQGPQQAQPQQGAFPAYTGPGQGQNQGMPPGRGYPGQFGQQGGVIPDRTGRPRIPKRIKRVFKPAATDTPEEIVAEEDVMFAKGLPEWSIEPPVVPVRRRRNG